MFRKSILVVASFALSAACGRTTDSGAGLVVGSQISPQPVRVGRAELMLTLQDRSTRPVIGAQVTVEAVMSHPGMAPTFYPANETGSGRYQSEIEFSMSGDWVIQLHVTLANGVKVEREIRVPAVAAR